MNSEIVHGIPSPQRKLREGDIVSIDFGMEVDGYFGDAAVTVPVGSIKPELQKLLDVTRESLDRAIDKMRPGNRLGDVGHAVQSWVEQHGYSVVREFVGHGIGTKMHDEPNLPNYGEPGRGPRCRKAWSSPSSRWSMQVGRMCRCGTSGWRKPPTAALQPISSTPWPSPLTALGF